VTQQYSTSTLRSYWATYKCKGGGSWADPLFFGKHIGGVPSTLVPAYAALEQALTSAGYHPPDKCMSVWSYNCRLIAGTDSYSLHSYGIAVDIDPPQNPYSGGDPYSGWMKEHHVDAVMKIRTTKGKGLWYWGGYWSSHDRMHFQIDNTPSDCQPDWSTVPEPEDDVTPADMEAIANKVVAKLNAEGVKIARTDYNEQTLYSNTVGLTDKEPKGDSLGADVKRILGAVSG
jgi:hypothetical protein